MVTHLARRDVFQAIADPNRRAILGLLANKKLTLNGVADQFKISRPAISKHIKILEECGLVTIEQQGRERYCVAKLEGLSDVEDWIAQSRKLWNDRFDRLEIYLAELQAAESSLVKTAAPKLKPANAKRAGKRTSKSNSRKRHN